jgi:hypothetical protein
MSASASASATTATAATTESTAATSAAREQVVRNPSSNGYECNR